MTTITALPPAPSRSDPINFADEADAFVAALPAFGTEANALASEVNADAATATTQAGIATTQAGIATTQAGIATTKASEALASANAAAASYDLFDDRWLGAKSGDPSVDNDGNPLTVGVAYFNTSTNLVRIYNGTGWQDALGSVTGQFTILRQVIVATAGQTLFNLSNTYVQGINALMVYVNGVRLTNADYTETSTTSITLASPLVAGDELLVEIGVTNTGSSVAAGIVTFNPAGTIAATNVQTAIQELDTEKVAKSGDTMTGPLSVPAGASGTQVPQAQEVVGLTGDQTIAGVKTFSAGPVLNNTVYLKAKDVGGVARDLLGIGGDNYVNFWNAGNLTVRILNQAGTTQLMQLSDASGNLVATGNVTAYSDERMKRNWAGLSIDFIERLANVKHGTYERIDTGERQVGVSAQALKELLPEAVIEDAEGILSVSYGNAALVAAIKLAERVLQLEARLALLEGK